MKNVEITLKSGALVTAHVTDENAKTIFKAKDDVIGHVVPLNLSITVPYKEEIGQDGLSVTTDDMAAVKVIDGDEEPNQADTEWEWWFILAKKNGKFMLLQDEAFNLKAFVKFETALRDVRLNHSSIGTTIVDLNTARKHMDNGLLTDVSAQQLKGFIHGIEN